MHLLLPIIWVLVLLVWSLLTRRKRVRRILQSALLVCLLVFSNDWLVTRLYGLWEFPVVPIEQVKGTYDVAVVLGGFTDLTKQPRDRVYLSQGADRLMHALYLYRLGKVRKILGSGGSGIVDFHDAMEAERIRSVLLTCHMDPKDILMETQARNTHENALFTTKILRKQMPNARVLVFTSAFHCRRAKACFEKQGMQVDMFPVDFRYGDASFNAEKALIPSEKAWDKWALLIHEVAGYLIYRIAGFA
jgi:uncharacterized SAM-binding protein YcdF (DUF218 family)